jgi:Flp pilus assembly protein TadG
MRLAATKTRNDHEDTTGSCRQSASRRGAAAVEFAVIAPLLFMLIFGMIEIGRAIMVAQIVVNASREGCRQATLSSKDVADVTTWTVQYLNSAGISTTAIASTTLYDEDGAEITSLANVDAGDPVRMTVTVNFAQLTWLPAGFAMSVMPAGAQITASTTMRKEAG